MGISDVMMYNLCMHRTQILLEERQYAALKAWARRVDKGLSELIRLAVDRLLGEEVRSRGGRLRSIRGIAADPRGPSGRDHDELLYGGRP
jgi:hypothetical protein